VNPVNSTVQSASRTWTDANGNFVPDCDLTNINANGECGPLQNTAFGAVHPSTTYASTYVTGFDTRDYTWRWSGMLQHELRPGLGLMVGYFGATYGNITISQNVAVTPADFSPYCVTSPLDSRLPGGGGNTQCDFWDVAPAKLGVVNTLVGPASKYGDVKQYFHTMDVATNVRLPGGGVIQGGISTGTMHFNACFAVNDPTVQVFAQNPSPPPGASTGFVALNNPDYCHGRQPWSNLTQLKVFASYPVFWGVSASANYQNLPGIADAANYTATSAQIAPSLGRNLAAGARATVTIPLVKPYTLFEARMSQLDVRLSKAFKVKNARVKGIFDIYNATNSNTVLSTNSTYGPAWLRPTSILPPRLFKFGAEVTF
jgi:hypothetical protein